MAQSILLFVGVLFSTNAVTHIFLRFYNYYGTVFRLRDCVIPNPVTEACFYGALGFLAAFAWSIVVWRKRNMRQQQYLFWFLIAGTLFAWFNVAKEFVAFYSVRSGPALGCSAVPIVSPWLTPCFTGATLFLFTCILAGVLHFRHPSRLTE